MSTLEDALVEARPLGTESSADIDPHHGLRPLMEAARLTRARVSVLPVRMIWAPERP